MTTIRISYQDGIERVADALLALESSRTLLEACEDLLAQLDALPARLYLHDSDAGVYYAAAGFACPGSAPDLGLDIVGDRNLFPLTSRGEPVGALAVLHDGMFHRAGVRQVAALLGPLLMQIHRREAAVQELRSAHQQIQLITSAGGLLRHLDVEVVLVKILETVLGAVRAQVGAVLVPDADGQLTCRVSWGLSDRHAEAIRLRSAPVNGSRGESRSLAEAVRAEGATVLIAEHELAERLDLAGLSAHLTGVLALPLATRDTVQGVVLCANPEGAFGPEEQRVAETLCSLAAIALDNALLVKATMDRERLRQELDLARRVQTGMYPPQGLARGAVTIEGTSLPCSETGGDYYTFLARSAGGQKSARSQDGREQGACLIAMIGDVSGHGLGAALFTTMAHAIIQQQLRAHEPIDASMRALNEGLFHTQSGRFMTAAVVEIDAVSGAFSYVSAGHNPLLWIHHGQPVWLESGGLPLGVMPETGCALMAPGALAPGDYLVLYTDGFVEAVDTQGQMWGDERFATVIAEGCRIGVAPKELIRLATTAVDLWAQGKAHPDDLTMVVIARR